MDNFNVIEKRINYYKSDVHCFQIQVIK